MQQLHHTGGTLQDHWIQAEHVGLYLPTAIPLEGLTVQWASTGLLNK